MRYTFHVLDLGSETALDADAEGVVDNFMGDLGEGCEVDRILDLGLGFFRDRNVRESILLVMVTVADGFSTAYRAVRPAISGRDDSSINCNAGSIG